MTGARAAARVAVVVAAAALASCGIELVDGSTLSPGETSAVVDMGTARVPTTAGDDRIARHDFEADSGPRRRLGLALADDKVRAALADLEALKRSWGASTGAGDRIATTRRPCEPDEFWVCVYGELARSSQDTITALASLFRAEAARAGLSSYASAALAIRYVQSLEYVVPDNVFGVSPPALVAWERRGDCDSRSLLAGLLLRELGHDVMLFSSESRTHAILGVALPGGRASRTVRGVRYALVESTSPRPIGEVSPLDEVATDWIPVRIQPKAKAAEDQRAPPIVKKKKPPDERELRREREREQRRRDAELEKRKKRLREKELERKKRTRAKERAKEKERARRRR